MLAIITVQYLLSNSKWPGSILSNLQALPHLRFLWGQYHHLCFAEKEAQAQRGYIAQSVRWNQKSNVGLSNARAT